MKQVLITLLIMMTLTGGISQGQDAAAVKATMVPHSEVKTTTKETHIATLKAAQTTLAGLQQQNSDLLKEQDGLLKANELVYNKLRDVTEFQTYLKAQANLADFNRRVGTYQEQVIAAQKASEAAQKAVDEDNKK